MNALALSVEPPWWSARGMMGFLLLAGALTMGVLALSAAWQARHDQGSRRGSRWLGAGFAAALVLFLILWSVPVPQYDYGFVAVREPPSEASFEPIEEEFRRDAPALARLLDEAAQEGRASLVLDDAWRHRQYLQGITGESGTVWLVRWSGYDVRVTERWFERE